MRTKSRKSRTSRTTLTARSRQPPSRLIDEQNSAILEKKKAELEAKRKRALAISKAAAKSAKTTQTKKAVRKVPVKKQAKIVKKRPATAKVTKKSTATAKIAAKVTKLPRKAAKMISAPPFARPSAVREVDLKSYNYGVAPHAGMHQGSLDIVFCLDCTGSMGSTITACQTSIVDMAMTLMNSERQDVRFSLIPYKDHHQADVFASLVYPFTRDTGQMQKNVNEQLPSGGGDQPEAVTAALFNALCLDWRPEAAKLVVFMADAGPHGLYPHGDTYPNGDPDGKDPLAIAREMHSLGIAVYGVISGTDDFTQKFFASLSAMTGGQCVALGDADLLKDAVLSSARENMDIERRMGNVHTAMHSEVRRLGRRLTDDETLGLASAVIADESHGARPRIMLSDKLIKVDPQYLELARSAQNITNLRDGWQNLMATQKAATTTSSAATTETAETAITPPTAEEEAADRVSRMARARIARSSDPVLVEITDLGARVLTEGYDGSKNVQFPPEVAGLVAGKRFRVDILMDAGAFYRVRGNVIAVADS